MSVYIDSKSYLGSIYTMKTMYIGVSLTHAMVVFVLLTASLFAVATANYPACCPEGYEYSNSSCQPFMNRSIIRSKTISVYKDQDKFVQNRSIDTFNIVRDPFCRNGDKYEIDEPFYLNSDGRLWLRDSGYLNEKEFCFTFNKGDRDFLPMGCSFEDNREVEQQNTIGMMISMPFLLVTFLIYACIPELQNLHGKCLMCYVITLFTAYVFLVTIQLSKEISSAYCVTAPFIIYFAFLVSFLWLNVMCIDIWWTFSGLRGFQGSARQSEKKRFLIYSAYAWGVPLFMLILTSVLQFVTMPDYIITPGFGTTKCWFPDDKTVGYYFYGPILLVIISNMCLFTYTTFKIWTVHRDTDRSMGHDSQRHGDETDKQRYKLYLKLMLVFGLNWLMEIISWAVTGPDWLWYVTDMCNAMYGVFIFFIFVCKANVWKLVKKRYHVFMGRPYLAKTYATGSSTRSTGFSHSVPNGSSELQMNDNSNM